MSAALRRRSATALLCSALAVVATALAAPGSASAHPLGNFSVNHAHALRFSDDRVVDEAVLDLAEIPTAQAARELDVDGDERTSATEGQAFADARCSDLLAAVRLRVDGAVTPMTVTAASFSTRPGAAGLLTVRVECTFEAELRVDRPRRVELTDDYEPGRVGWHEITATAEDGVELVDPPVPSTSQTDQLRQYPVELLESPLDVRSVELVVRPGTGQAPGVAPAAGAGRDTGSASGVFAPLRRVVDRIDGEFDDLIGRRDLTLGIGLIAVALSVLLGASHALLPGHGKTVMAAYLAGRQGTSRDAIVVGATVTATHTGGVLLIGLALTLSSSLAGEVVLAWLGVASGALIALLGASLLRSSWRGGADGGFGHHHHGPGGHHHHGPRGRHDHAHDHTHDHTHDHHSHGHGHDHDHAEGRRGGARRLVRARGARQGADGLATASAESGRRDDRVTIGRRREDPAGAGATTALLAAPRRSTARVVARRTAVVPVSSGVSRAVVDAPQRTSRRALVGMGIAGGLVPSPSALVVLLSAIALGRTAFGVLLVIGYGLGMAATLTIAGLLLVKLRDRLVGRTAQRMGPAAARWMRIAPKLTAALVLIVGLGLVARSLGQL